MKKYTFSFALTFVVTIFLSSCASYKYEGARRTQNNSLNIYVDNVEDFHISSNVTINSGTTAYQGRINPLFTKVKKQIKVAVFHPNYDTIKFDLKRKIRIDALAKDIALSIFTFGIPLIVDFNKADFYKIAPESKEFKLHMEFRQNYMKQEYLKIKNSSIPNDFEKYIVKYPKYTGLQMVINRKDSLELAIALSKFKESSIDDYIASHSKSVYLKKAQDIKSNMAAAREMFSAASKENTVAAYEKFLEKFPSSLHDLDVHLKLLDAAEKNALASKSVDKMEAYIMNYFKPISTYLDKNQFELKKNSITSALDNQLSLEFIGKDNKKLYNNYSTLWKRYQKLKSSAPKGYLDFFSKTEDLRHNISDLIFEQIKAANTEEKQRNLYSKADADFPSFHLTDSKYNLFHVVLDNLSAGAGNVKLFNVNYLLHRFNEMSERDILIGRKEYTYKGSNYSALKNITTEELTFLKGQLTGQNKALSGSNTDFLMNQNGSEMKDISYYQDGKLVKTIYFLPKYETYEYEFENGINISLQELDRQINDGNNLIRENNFDAAIFKFEAARKNNFPGQLPQNIKLDNLLSKAKNDKITYQNKLEKERRAAIENAPSDLESGKYDSFLELQFGELLLALEASKVLGQEYYDKKAKEMEQNIERRIGHKLTQSDLRYIKKFTDRYIERIKQQNQRMEELNRHIDAKSRPSVCLNCGRTYESKFGWRIKDNRNCDVEKNTAAVLLYGGGDAYCSQGCAKECCQRGCN